MRFSDFLLVSDPGDLDFIVGYTEEQNIRISVSDFFGNEIFGSGNPGYIPVFTGTQTLGNSQIFQDGSNIVIGGVNAMGYRLAVGGSLYTANGAVINSTVSGADALRVIGGDGDIFVIPNDLGQSISSLRRIIHPPAILTTESATLGQLNTAISNLDAEIDILLNLKVDKSSVGVPNGVASLDSGGKIPLSQIPDSIIGQVQYMGTWNAFTNTPTLNPIIPEERGHYYVVSAAGVFAGMDFQIGDWIISNGVIWEKVDNTDAVTSVFGRIGAILALEADYQAFYPRLSQAYDNPTWINTLAFTKITGVPAFLLENQTITLSGDVTGSGKTSIVSTISNNAVSNEKLRDSVGTSVIGRSTSTTGDPADIQATTDGHVLLRSAGNLLFGLISGDSISSINWSKITGTPTTLSGYGITDAYTKTESDNKFVPYTGANANVNLGSNNITANSFIKAGGTSSQFLKADGSVDTSQYVPTTRSVNAGTGLTGGGNLSSDITIAFDTTWGDNRYAYRTRQLTINGVTYDLSADRTWSVGTVNTLTTLGTSGPATLVGNTLNIPQYTDQFVGTVTSVGISMPPAFTVSNSPVTSSGTLTVVGAGNATQYVRGDGALATLPTGGGGGGASINYYLNGSINQGTIGGVTYYEMNRTPIIGTGTDFTRNTNGYIASFLTDAGDPSLLAIPAGNWNFETYFNASSGGGSPTFYIELYKYDGTTFTLIASNSGSPKLINDGTRIEAYYSALAVPQTTLTLTDRLAIRIYVNTSGRTITLHTENGHLCEVITTFTTGLSALNGLTTQVQYLATGTSGADFNILSAVDTHTFNLPTASAVNRGALSSADWTVFNGKQNAITLTTTGTSGLATLIGSTLNIPNYTTDLSGYVTLATDQTITGLKTILRGGDVLNFKIGTDTLYGLKVAYNQNELVPSGEATWSFVNTFNNGSGTGLTTTPISFFRGVLVTGERLLSASVNTNLLDYYASNPTGRYPIYAYNTGVQQFASSIIVGETNGVVNAITGSIADLPAGVVANFKGRVIGSNAVNNNEFVTLSQLTSGYVSNVTASSPLFSSGGATPNITIQQASGSQSGFLSSTDWTTFNSKIGGTLATGQVAFGTATNTIGGNNNLFWDNTNVRLGIGINNPRTVLDVATGASNALGIGNVSDTISSGDLIGAISFISRDASTNSSGGVSNIRSYATATYNTGAVSADLRFYVTNGLSNPTSAILFGTEAMRITSAGYLWLNGGISGFSGSQVSLQVPDSARIAGQLILHNSANTALSVALRCVAASTLQVDGAGIFTDSITASSGSARGLQIISTLIASANSDKLSSLYIQPTFTTSGFSNVEAYLIRAISSVGSENRRFTYGSNTGTFKFNDNANVTPLVVENTYSEGFGVGILFNLGYNGSGTGDGIVVNGAKILSMPENIFTATASTQDASLVFQTVRDGNLIEGLKIRSTGQFQGAYYGSGIFTGTVAYNLAVDSNGNIIETAGGIIDGSGTANYIPRWQDANTLTNSIIYDDGTNVGIGTNIPSVNLDIRSFSSGGTKLRIRNENNSGSASIIINPEGAGAAIGDATVFYDVNSTAWVEGIDKSDASKFKISNDPNGNFSTNNYFTIQTNGNVGINTTTPSYRLDVRVSDATAYTTSSLGNILQIYNTYAANGSFAGISFVTEPTSGNAATASINVVSIGSGSAALTFGTRGNSVFSEKIRITETGNLLVNATNSDIGGSVNGIALTSGNKILVSNNTTGIDSFLIYGDRRGTNNIGGVYMLAMGGFYKSSIGVLGTNNTTDDGGLTFNTISGNTTAVTRMSVTTSGINITGTGIFSSSVTIQSGNSLFVSNSGNTRTGFLRTSNSGTELSSFAGAGEPLFLIAPDTTASIRFYVGGSTVAAQRMILNASGQLLIGTDSPQSGTRLQVAGVLDVWSSTNTLLRFNHDGTRGLIESFTGGGYAPTSINPFGGNVLIGTTSDAGFKLDVNGRGRFTAGAGQNGLVVNGVNSVFSQSITAGTGTGTSFGMTISAGTNSSDIAFQIYNSAENAVRLFVRGDGNVGIGTASPAAELQVAKTNDVTIAMSNSSSVTSGSRGSIAWYNSSVSSVAIIRAAAVTDNVGTELQFYTRPAAGSLTQTMTITSNGYLWVNGAISGFTGSTVALMVNGASRLGGNTIIHQAGSANQIVLSCPSNSTLNVGGQLGVNNSTPSGIFHATSNGITASSPSLGWPVYNAELDANARSIYVDTTGNGSVATAGSGATVVLQLGQYYDSRVVITPIGSGGAGPSDQGTGTGKDLMLKAGTSDNGAGFKGGRLYLNGGMGYQSAFNANGGDILMQSLTGSGDVLVGLSSNIGGKLQVGGQVRAENFSVYRGGSFRGGIYTYEAVTGSGSDRGMTIFAEGGANNGNIYFCPNGSVTRVMTINTSSNVLIGTSSDNGDKLLVSGNTTLSGRVGVNSGSISGISLVVLGQNNGSSDFGLVVRNSSSLGLFSVRNDGGIFTGTSGASPYNNTTGSSSNVHVSDNGLLFRSTSSLKYKTDIKDYDKGLAEVMQMRPVYYKGKNDGDTQFAGLIAEEIHKLGLTEFVQYAKDGTPDALAYSNMVALLVKAIQEQQIQIDKLKNV